MFATLKLIISVLNEYNHWYYTYIYLIFIYKAFQGVGMYACTTYFNR